MIKHSLFLIVVGVLVSTNAYCNTEIKPPEGPFVSLLRTTFSEQVVSVNVKKMSIKEKVYTFQVPDLGRYQERAPATISSRSMPIIAPKFSPFDQIEKENSVNSNIFDTAPLDMPVNEFKAFNDTELKDSPFAFRPNNQENLKTPNQPKSFDNLPIEYKQSEQERSYPSEWASSFSNQQRPNNAVNMINPRQNQSFVPNNQNQPSPMMGMPFPNQMPLWPLGNSQNSNAGYN